MEGGEQGFNGGDGEDGGFGAGFGREVGASDRDVSDQAGEDFDLAVTDVTREAGEPRQLECLAEERMTRLKPEMEKANAPEKVSALDEMHRRWNRLWGIDDDHNAGPATTSPQALPIVGPDR